MKRILLPIFVLGLSLAAIALGRTAEPNTDQAMAIAEIERLGGTVAFDENDPNKAVISLEFLGNKLTDKGLAHCGGRGALDSFWVKLRCGVLTTPSGPRHPHRCRAAAVARVRSIFSCALPP